VVQRKVYLIVEIMGWADIHPPKIINLISRNEFEPAEDLASLSQNQQIVIVSFFGPSQFTSTPPKGENGFKKAFQLAIGAFGSIQMTSHRKSSGSSESRDANNQAKKVSKETNVGFA